MVKKYRPPKRKVVTPPLDETQWQFKKGIAAIQTAISALQQQLDDQFEKCPHAIAYEIEGSTWCEICGVDFGWHCPVSPDHACHYYSERSVPGMEPIVKLNNGGIAYLSSDYEGDWETDDCCIFCHQPNERK